MRRILLFTLLIVTAGAMGAQAQSFDAWNGGLVNDDPTLIHPSVTNAAAYAPTTYGMQVDLDTVPFQSGNARVGMSVIDLTPVGERRYRARFYLNAQDYDPGIAFNHRRLHLLLAQADTNIRFLQVELRRVVAGGNFSIVAGLREDGTTVRRVVVSPEFSPNSWHYIEFDLQLASAAGATDGRFEGWLDGVSWGLVTNFPNYQGGLAVDKVRLGAMKAEEGANGTIYLDEFESRRQTYIGLLP
jgi:hypothetical protein